MQWDSKGKWQLLLRSVDGKIVMERDDQTKKINVEHLSPGVYFIDIQSEEGRFSKKIIKL